MEVDEGGRETRQDTYLLASSCELAEEAHNVVRRLPVETRGRLVQEQEQVGLGSKLDTDGDTLARLNRETVAGEADHAVREILELEELDDVLDIRVLLGLRDSLGLAEVRREPESLADGGSPLVDVELFGIRTATGEGDVDRAAVHEEIALDNTDRLARRQHIQERGLAGARRAHERSKRARLDIAVHVGEELTLAAGDGDSILEPLPGERRGGHGEVAEVLVELAGAVLHLALLETLIELLELLGGLGEHDDGEVRSAELDLLHEEH